MQSEPISSSGPVPPGKPPSPQKTRKTRLLLLSGIVLLVLVVSSILAVVLLPKKPSTSGPSTPTVPAGFQQFSSTYFSIIYPLGWSVNPTTSPIGDEFYNPAQSFDVSIDLNESGLNEYEYTALLCSGPLDTNSSSPDNVKIGGVSWVRRTCDNPPFHTVVEAAFHQGNLFSITYFSNQDNFSADAAQYYQPMEQSFTFLS